MGERKKKKEEWGRRRGGGERVSSRIRRHSETHFFPRGKTASCVRTFGPPVYSTQLKILTSDDRDIRAGIDAGGAVKKDPITGPWKKKTWRGKEVKTRRDRRDHRSISARRADHGSHRKQYTHKLPRFGMRFVRDPAMMQLFFLLSGFVHDKDKISAAMPEQASAVG